MSSVVTYFIAEDGSDFVKIGISRRPALRVLGLQTGNPRKLVLLGFVEGDHELRLRKRFSSTRVGNSEWHIKTPEMIEFLSDKPTMPIEERPNTKVRYNVTPRYTKRRLFKKPEFKGLRRRTAQVCKQDPGFFLYMSTLYESMSKSLMKIERSQKR